MTQLKPSQEWKIIPIPVTAAWLKNNCFLADGVGKNKKGNFVFRRGYFYRHGQSAESFASDIMAQLEKFGLKANLVDSGDHYASFRGGASLRTSSHFWAEVRITQPAAELPSYLNNLGDFHD